MQVNNFRFLHFLNLLIGSLDTISPPIPLISSSQTLSLGISPERSACPTQLSWTLPESIITPRPWPSSSRMPEWTWKSRSGLPVAPESPPVTFFWLPIGSGTQIFISTMAPGLNGSKGLLRSSSSLRAKGRRRKLI